ncbi:MAG: hypothetical protein LBS80_01975 [Tannerella sp.]|jgi:hypothetical protein|nr:hypothetical protein [Tannerella sp.]
MSFAGHILDMIRRDKENRELRKNLRQSKFTRKKYYLKDADARTAVLSEEEFKRDYPNIDEMKERSD